MSTVGKTLADVPVSSAQSHLLGLTDGKVTRQSVKSFLQRRDLDPLPDRKQYDLDDFIETGIYFFHTTLTKNDPLMIGSGYILLVFRHTNNYACQIAIYGMWHTGMYIRKLINGTWNSWVPFTNDAMPT